MTAEDDIHTLAGLLSDYERRQLAEALRQTVAGRRVWEDDIGVFYHQYVKTRSSEGAEGYAPIIPALPAAEDGLFFPIPMVKHYPGTDRAELPPPGDLTAELSATVRKRRSRRDFTGAPISTAQLSTLLQHSCGTTGMLAGYGYDSLPLRSFPSAGGLQSPEVYLSIQAVTGLTPGLYHYQPIDHALESLRPGSHGETLSAFTLGQQMDQAAVVFLITGYYDRLRWKYGERAYRYLCMDTGFLGQNLCLGATALDLGACPIAGFLDDAVDQLLGIDGRGEMSMLLVGVGAVQ